MGSNETKKKLTLKKNKNAWVTEINFDNTLVMIEINNHKDLIIAEKINNFLTRKI